MRALVSLALIAAACRTAAPAGAGPTTSTATATATPEPDPIVFPGASPDNTRGLFLLLDTQQFRDTAFADEISSILRALPAFYFAKGGLDPLRILKRVAFGSFDATNSLAGLEFVWFRFPHGKLRAGLELAVREQDETIAWETASGVVVGDPSSSEGVDRDPRVFALFDTGRAAYLSPEYLRKVDGLLRAADDLNAEHGGHALSLFMSPKGVFRAASAPFTLPARLELVVDLTPALNIRTRLAFESSLAAEGFAEYWKERLPDALRRAPLPDLHLFYEATGLQQSSERVELTTQLSPPQGEYLLQMIALVQTTMLAPPADAEERRDGTKAAE